MSEGENAVPGETFPRFFPTFWSLLSFTLNCGQKAILIYTKHILKLKGNEEKRAIKKIFFTQGILLDSTSIFRTE